MTPDEIKALRQRLGVTQDGLARLVPTTQVTVNRWERGHRKPSPLYALRLRELAATVRDDRERHS
jgi:DNA-binding transcriptional regulator YiaG